MPNYHVTVHGTDREAMADLGRAHHVYVYRQTLIDEGLGYRVSALADEQTILRLQGAGYQVERHDDVHQVVQHLRHHAAFGQHGHSFAPVTRKRVVLLPHAQMKSPDARAHDRRASKWPLV
ncbi:MAG: hypothetical protein M3460_27300 [Actinomycetota bacterium]|nr:hypothetical protein [Actinomycetota bacterium]